MLLRASLYLAANSRGESPESTNREFTRRSGETDPSTRHTIDKYFPEYKEYNCFILSSKERLFLQIFTSGSLLCTFLEMNEYQLGMPENTDTRNHEN